MNTNLLILFFLVFLLFSMQSVGGYFQIRAYQRAIKRSAGFGAVGVGQKRGGLLSGHLVLIACDQTGIITHCEVMDGITFLSRFHEVHMLLGHPMIGSSLDEFMEVFQHLNKRGFKQNKGYIQAIDALCKRLHPERYTEDELNRITLKSMQHQ